jgi:hypothetical protein
MAFKITVFEILNNLTDFEILNNMCNFKTHLFLPDRC